MAGSHNEKALARIEALIGQEEEPRPIVRRRSDGQPAREEDLLGWHGGTPEAQAAARTKWLKNAAKAESARVKKVKAKIAEIDAQLARARTSS
jgi:hypothetical protein